MADDKQVDFKTSVSWAGETFSLIPGDVTSLPESIAKAREQAGLGTIIKNK